MSQKAHRIKEVVPGSIAQEAGVEPGDLLVSVNGLAVNDIIEYRYVTNEEYIEVLVEKPGGERWLLEIEKELTEDPGMVFEDDIMDEARRCRNRCIFCFIDQLPGGMRESLYFKDDDSRLSFLQGNFITLTNLKKEDIDRIIKYRISPLNISVHTTDRDLRVRMLRNPKAGEMLELLEIFVNRGIILNCQVVLCPGINDGLHLDKTIGDLAKLWPGVYSIGVVPVGITRFRDGLFPIQGYTERNSKEVVSRIEGWQAQFIKQRGNRIVYAADEFYLKAGLPIPEAEEYADFPQLENGIGVIALFTQQFEKGLSKVKGYQSKNRVISIATGQAAYGFMQKLCGRLEREVSGLKVRVYPIANYFFGETIDVSGLITGTDLMDQLNGKELGDVLLIPENMLRSGERVFLDGVTVDQAEKNLRTNIAVCPVRGDELLTMMMREEIS